MAEVPTPTWAHPDPNKKLFGFEVAYANGATDFGLAVAPDSAAATQAIMASSFVANSVRLIVNDQPTFVNTIVERYHGVAFLTRTPSCN